MKKAERAWRHPQNDGNAQASFNNWTEVPAPESNAQFRTWAPDQMNGRHVLVGTLGEFRTVDTQHGDRDVIEVIATRAGRDINGPWDIGDVIDVWISAGLRNVPNLPDGTEIAIIPNGFEGKMKRYIVRQKPAV